MGVTVEHKRGSVCISSLIFPEQPFSHRASRQHRRVQRAHLVQTIARRAKHGTRIKKYKNGCEEVVILG